MFVIFQDPIYAFGVPKNKRCVESPALRTAFLTFNGPQISVHHKVSVVAAPGKIGKITH